MMTKKDLMKGTGVFWLLWFIQVYWGIFGGYKFTSNQGFAFGLIVFMEFIGLGLVSLLLYLEIRNE